MRSIGMDLGKCRQALRRETEGGEKSAAILFHTLGSIPGNIAEIQGILGTDSAVPRRKTVTEEPKFLQREGAIKANPFHLAYYKAR